jgi:hypothetical protein
MQAVPFIQLQLHYLLIFLSNYKKIKLKTNNIINI